MSTTKLIPTRNLSRTVDYVQKDKYGRSRAVYFASLNCSYGNAKREMMRYIRLLGKETNVQGLHVIQTFAADELSSENLYHHGLAARAGWELARKMWPDRQVIVVTQTDGKSGLLHNHIVVNQSSLKDGKSLVNEQKHHYHVARENDRVLKDLGIRNVLEGKANYHRERDDVAEEYLRDNGVYLYKDDLAERLDIALGYEPNSLKEFHASLDMLGVSVTLNNRGDDYQYHFKDRHGKARHAMGKRLDRDKYSLKAIHETVEANQVEADRVAREQREQEEQAERLRVAQEALRASQTVLDVEEEQKPVKVPEPPKTPQKPSPSVSDDDLLSRFRNWQIEHGGSGGHDHGPDFGL